MKFDNVAVACTDIGRSRDWYAGMFGFRPGYAARITTSNADFQVMERDDMRLELISRDGCVRNEDAALDPPDHLGVSNIIAIVFSTDDLKADTAALEAKGAEFVWVNLQLSDDGLRSSMLRDPDGNMINVLQYPVGAA